MIVKAGIFTLYLVLLAWFFLYPYFLFNFLTGGGLQSEFSAAHVLFGSGFVLWVISLIWGFIAFKQARLDREKGMRILRGDEEKYIVAFGFIGLLILVLASALGW